MKDALKALGLEDDVIESILNDVVNPHIETEVKGLKDKNYLLVGEKKTLTEKLKALETESPNTEPLKTEVPETKPDPLLVQLAESVKSLQQQIRSTEQRNIKQIVVSKYLADAKNPNIILNQLDLDKLSENNGKVMMTIDDGSEVEISSIFEPMRKSEETSFLFGKTATTTRKTATVMGIEIPLEDAVKLTELDIPNPWSAKNFNYTKQNELLSKNPELAGKLKEAAKAESPSTAQQPAQQAQQQLPQTPPPHLSTPTPMLVNPFA